MVNKRGDYDFSLEKEGIVESIKVAATKQVAPNNVRGAYDFSLDHHDGYIVKPAENSTAKEKKPAKKYVAHEKASGDHGLNKLSNKNEPNKQPHPQNDVDMYPVYDLTDKHIISGHQKLENPIQQLNQVNNNDSNQPDGGSKSNQQQAAFQTAEAGQYAADAINNLARACQNLASTDSHFKDNHKSNMELQYTSFVYQLFMFRKAESKGQTMPNNVEALQSQIEQKWLQQFAQLAQNQNPEIKAFGDKVSNAFKLTQKELKAICDGKN